MVAAPSDSLPVIRAQFTTTPPKIDGELEELWHQADSAWGFVQQQPEAGKPATENTTVYFLYDQRNVYVAYWCAVRDMNQVHDRLVGDADGVQLLIDPFDDNATCYSFTVGFNGVESAMRITGDGSGWEYWSGVWRSAVQRYDAGFVIEVAIPFKTLRYHPGKSEWGIDFGRTVVANGERSFWAKHEITGFKVSRMGRLIGIHPGGRGLHLELYPVGLVRTEKTGNAGTWRDKTNGAFGFDGAYFPSSSANLQLTVFPDFAQIEADPYQVNLSRYEIYLAERRPFFTEAAETFGGSSQPIKIFYSRRVGKPLPDGTVVPILGGVKYTDRFLRGQLGMMVAATGELAAEPQSVYSALAVRRQIFKNSEIGLLYAGKDNRQFSNHGLALDGVFYTRSFTGRLFLAGSQFGDSFDYALSAEGSYQSPAAIGGFYFRQIQPRFNMNGPGYTTWRGQYFSIYGGPAFYNRGAVQSANFYPGIELQREWDAPERKFSGDAFVNGHIRFENNYFINPWFGAGRHWAMAQWYNRSFIGVYFATDATRPISAQIWGEYLSRTANYRRGIIAPSIQGELSINARLGDRWSMNLAGNLVVEADTSGQVDLQKDITIVLRPGINHIFSAKSFVQLTGEIVRGYEPLTAQRYTTGSVFALYSWTFRPRSNFYFAVNLFRDPNGEIRTIQVVKVRYLFSL